ncbi:hypothetical protein NQ318_005847 [Aromia moschata]|uniref:C2H2-type domain-containing protein n=1 Tax=Aromia moschata TaxID=1265417 RepID=A0AAV8YTP5_9CUCU|nr:hypothetical protein NQ318_005847 [Aromia moschata]
METKLCRICGKLGQNFVHIFKTEGLRDKIETCLPIIVSVPALPAPGHNVRECMESVNNFYDFIKNCLQNIIILEAQYDIRESCLKSKQKKEKGCNVNFSLKNDSRAVQTDDYLDAKPTTSLVEYDVDSDSNVDEGDENSGKVVLGHKFETFIKINNPVESVLSGKTGRFAKRCYFDDAENDLISEISQRKKLKRKADSIETCLPKIFKMDTTSRRKNKQPKRLDTHALEIRQEAALSNVENYDENVVNPNALEKPDLPVCDADNQQNPAQAEKLLSSLPQSCLLCDTHFSGPAALATHVFETHGIDMTEVISSGSGESFAEKSKKKIPNLVKISDLRRSDSTEDNLSPEQQPEDPPTLLPSFVCPNCPAVFTTKPDLMIHLRLKHAEQGRLPLRHLPAAVQHLHEPEEPLTGIVYHPGLFTAHQE